jgi:cytochrome c oxidase subunit 2
MIKYLFVFISFLSAPVLANQPHPWALYFQEPATPIMEKLKDFHDFLLIISFFIAFFVFFMMFLIIYKFREKKHPIPATFTHNTPLEIVWTLIPITILIFIAIPSFKIMYMMDHIPKADITVKVVGHQWYWSYEYPEHKITYDSYMIKDEDLKPGDLRLLSVDKPLVVPIDTVIEVLVTSTDVIHSFAVPSFGIKKDCVPGKLNQTWMKIKKEGLYYGQCSELCGSGHGFMPIAVKAVSAQEYAQWIQKQKK